MSCGCENLKKRLNLGVMKSLAEKAAVLDGCEYVVYEYRGAYNFCRVGDEVKGKEVARVNAQKL